MVHQPSGGAQGQATDIEIQAKEILGLRKKLNNIYVHHTGQKLPEIERVMERDTFMSADEAQKFGLIDHVVATRDDIPKPKEDKSLTALPASSASPQGNPAPRAALSASASNSFSE